MVLLYSISNRTCHTAIRFPTQSVVGWMLTKKRAAKPSPWTIILDSCSTKVGSGVLVSQPKKDETRTSQAREPGLSLRMLTLKVAHLVSPYLRSTASCTTARW